MFIHIPIHIQICIYGYIYIHTHTHIYIYIHIPYRLNAFTCSVGGCSIGSRDDSLLFVDGAAKTSGADGRWREGTLHMVAHLEGDQQSFS